MTESNDNIPILIIADDYARQSRLSTYELVEGRAVTRATIDNYREILKSQWFRLIVIDSQQADSDILRMCRDIRTASRQPILLLTYKAEEDFLLRAYEAGVQECVIRPIGSKLLEAKVEAWLRWTVSEPEKTPDLAPEHRRVMVRNGLREDSQL